MADPFVQVAAQAISKWKAYVPYSIGDQVVSPTDYNSYTRKTVGAGNIDPVTDTTNWQANFTGIKSIRRGITTGSSYSTTSTLNPAVVPAKTEIRYLGGNSSVTAGGALDGPARVELTNSTTITCYWPGGSGTASWELTERY